MTHGNDIVVHWPKEFSEHGYRHIGREVWYSLDFLPGLHLMCDLTIAADNAVFGQTGPIVGSFDGGFGQRITDHHAGSLVFSIKLPGTRGPFCT